MLSLIVSAITELFAWVVSLRHEFLKSGIKGLLGNDFGEKLLDHPLVRSDIRRAKQKKFSYVSSRNFTLALIDALRAPRGECEGRLSLEEGIDERTEGDLAVQLHALRRYAGKETAEFRAAAELWFDEAMDRVSGWYRRWTQVITCVIALAVAVGLNVDAIRVADRIANDETVRAVLVKTGDAYVKQVKVEQDEAKAGEAKGQGAQGGKGKGGKANQAGTKGKGGQVVQVVAGKPVPPGVAANVIQRQIDDVSALSLPIGWEAGFSPNVSTVVGWLITAIAISLGAPFWFDALSKLARLRTTGEKPKTSSDSQA